MLGLLVANAANPPTFYDLEPFAPGGFLVHFDTEANRRYELLTRSTTPVPGSGTNGWTTLYVVDSVPFPNHFIVLDPETNSVVRFYRLIADP